MTREDEQRIRLALAKHAGRDLSQYIASQQDVRSLLALLDTARRERDEAQAMTVERVGMATQRLNEHVAALAAARRAAIEECIAVCESEAEAAEDFLGRVVDRGPIVVAMGTARGLAARLRALLDGKEGE